MSSARWWNLVLWGLGDRLDGVADMKSNLLLAVNLLIWIDAIAFLLTGGAVLFVELVLLGPLLGHPIPWAGTQIVVGLIMTKGWSGKKKTAQISPPAQVHPPQSAPAQPGVSEEP